MTPPIPIPKLSDAALLDAIRLLQSTAYRKLSRIHTVYLEELELEARVRHLSIP